MPDSVSNMLIPAGAGVGLKAEHFDDILGGAKGAQWFEVHAENYMCAGGQPHHYLTRIRENYPLSIHGVGLSIGAECGIDPVHLARLKTVCDRYQPGLVSEHLAWSTHTVGYLNDLLPVPYTHDVLQRVCVHIDQIQNSLGRQILLENPSTYLQFEASEMDEVTFITEVSKRSGCGLLLDVNNVYVSATNHGYCASDYLMRFPVAAVQELHLAGFGEDVDDGGARLLIDSHDAPIAQAVWALLETTLMLTGPKPILIERDSNLPPWSVLVLEAKMANDYLSRESMAEVRYG